MGIGILDMDYKVDAIITTYNEPVDKINIAINSCLNQTLPFEKIYVIDDGSKISPENEIIKNSKIVFIRLKENCGISAARNLALNISNSSYVGILNVDIELSKDWLSKLINDLNNNRHLGAAYSKLLPISTSLISQWRMRFHEQRYDKLSGISSFAPGHAVLFDKNKIAQIGFYNEKLKLVHEDADICIRLKEIGFETFYNSTVTIVSHQVDSILLICKKHIVRMTSGKSDTISTSQFLITCCKDFVIRISRNLIKFRWVFLPVDIFISINCILLYFNKSRLK